MGINIRNLLTDGLWLGVISKEYLVGNPKQNNLTCTSGKCIFDANMLKVLTLTKISLKIIFGNSKDKYIQKGFLGLVGQWGLFQDMEINQIQRYDKTNKHMNK